MCVDDAREELIVRQEGDIVVVTIADYPKEVYDTKIVAQSVTCTTLICNFLTAAMIYAARDLIAVAVAAVWNIASTVVNVSLNAIITQINKVKSGRVNVTTFPIPKVNVGVWTNTTQKKQTVFTRTVVQSSIKTITKSKKVSEQVYFTAWISNNEVIIGHKISKSSAIARLKKGYDVFATTEAAAKSVCKAASPRQQYKRHTSHVKGEGYYYHYHPVGLKWYLNKKYQPHCWYP